MLYARVSFSRRHRVDADHYRHDGSSALFRVERRDGSYAPAPRPHRITEPFVRTGYVTKRVYSRNGDALKSGCTSGGGVVGNCGGVLLRILWHYE